MVYYYDPQIDLEIEGFMIPWVVVNFGSQVNILPKGTLIKMGRNKLVRSRNFLKLSNQIFIKSIRLLKGTKTNIMGMKIMVYFEVIDLFKDTKTYKRLVRRPRGRRMKEIISLKKYR
jgi:hypothetical protein